MFRGNFYKTRWFLNLLSPGTSEAELSYFEEVRFPHFPTPCPIPKSIISALCWNDLPNQILSARVSLRLFSFKGWSPARKKGFWRLVRSLSNEKHECGWGHQRWQEPKDTDSFFVVKMDKRHWWGQFCLPVFFFKFYFNAVCQHKIPHCLFSTGPFSICLSLFSFQHLTARLIGKAADSTSQRLNCEVKHICQIFLFINTKNTLSHFSCI